MVFRLPVSIGLGLALVGATAWAQPAPRTLDTAEDYVRQASELFQSGQYFKAARYAFSAGQMKPELKPVTHAWVAVGLIKSRLYQSASYFFIRTLQLGDRPSVERVLHHAEELMVAVGPDLLREYLVRHTQPSQYPSPSQGTSLNAYLYALAKNHLLKGENEKAIDAVQGMRRSGHLWTLGLMARATAHAILASRGAGSGAGAHAWEALEDFKSCASRARDMDLEARCWAGVGRTYYQMNLFDEAEAAYDRIPKHSWVWPDALFEEAWNAFAQGEFNRTLGRLVSYKSPSLRFVHNPEIDVLRAQAFLALCQYGDANEVIQEFHAKYTRVGEEIKRFVESRSNRLADFFERGKAARRVRLHTDQPFDRVLNRFVRSPQFQSWVKAEARIPRERDMIAEFDRRQPGVSHDRGEGFPGFLDQVLRWRTSHIRALGGAFVKNSLMDHHAALIDDFEKIAFIKLEMLKRAKDQLMGRPSTTQDRSRGQVRPTRKDHQYYWDFNGEFWNDEIGDYVFGLESAC